MRSVVGSSRVSKNPSRSKVRFERCILRLIQGTYLWQARLHEKRNATSLNISGGGLLFKILCSTEI